MASRRASSRASASDSFSGVVDARMRWWHRRGRIGILRSRGSVLCCFTDPAPIAHMLIMLIMVIMVI